MFCLPKIQFVRTFSSLSMVSCRSGKVNIHCIGRRASWFSKPIVLVRNEHIRHKSLFRIFNKETVEKIKAKDNIPDHFVLIYRNKMEKYMLCAQIFSTVLSGVLGLALLASDHSKQLTLPTEFFSKPVGAVENEMYIYIGAFIGFCVVLQLYLQKMPLRIYNYPKRNAYTLVFYGALPGTKKSLTCVASDVVKSERLGILPWTESTYNIKDKRKVILIEHYFRTPADLNIMLGYQEHNHDE